jgi:hypothetical protein
LIRRREISSASDYLRLVLMYALSGLSLRLLGAWGCLHGIGYMSDVAVLKRLQKCPTWLGELIGCLLQKRCQVLQAMPGIRLRLVDATVISRPGSQGTDWRVHLGFDLGRMCLDGIEVTDAHGGETLARFAAQAPEIRVADRGYAHAAGIGSLLNGGGHLVVRTNWHNLPLEQMDGSRFQMLAWLSHLTTSQECPVWLNTPQGRFGLRLLACPLPPEKAEEARRRVRRAKRKKGKTVSPQTLLAAGFVLLLTDLPAQEWPLPMCLELYRLRWQIEIAIKRLKSILDLDALRARDPRLVQAFLLAKLLAAILIEGLLAQAYPSLPDWFVAVERPLSLWRLTHFGYFELHRLVAGECSLARFFQLLPTLTRYFCASPRKRKQQLAWARAVLDRLSSSEIFFSC